MIYSSGRQRFVLFSLEYYLKVFITFRLVLDSKSDAWLKLFGQHSCRVNANSRVFSKCYSYRLKWVKKHWRIMHIPTGS